MAYRDPKTKEEILNRMMQRDFNGDLSTLAADGAIQLQRIKRHVLRLVFPTTGKKFDLTIHKPRPEVTSRATAKKPAAAARTNGAKASNAQRLDALRKGGNRNKRRQHASTH